MYFEINVSKNGSHYFATSKRSLTSPTAALKMVKHFKEVFPEEKGYEVFLTKWELIGEDIEVA